MDRASPTRNPVHLQLSDFLVQPGDQSGVATGLLVRTVAEDAGGAIGEGFLPGLNLAGVDPAPAASWATVPSPFATSRATLVLKVGLCFLRPLDISHSSSTATAALSLGAGLSLSYLSSFLGPPQYTPKTKNWPSGLGQSTRSTLGRKPSPIPMPGNAGGSNSNLSGNCWPTAVLSWKTRRRSRVSCASESRSSSRNCSSLWPTPPCHRTTMPRNGACGLWWSGAKSAAAPVRPRAPTPS